MFAMTELKIVLVFVLAAASCLVSENLPENELWEKAVKLTSKIILREDENALKAIKDVEIKTQADRIRIAGMANNALGSTVYSIYALNILLPNIVSDQATYLFLVHMALNLSKAANDVQQVVHGDPGILKEKLAGLLNVSKDIISSFSQDFRITNGFIYNQLVNAIDHAIYSVYKLHLQAKYFKETNKNLASKISEAQADFGKTIKSLPNDDKNTEIKLRHLLADLAVMVQTSVSKLQNWIEINRKDAKNVEIAKEVSKTLSDIYKKLNHAVTGHQTSAFLKSQLHSMNGLAAEDIQKLAEIDYAENLGGEEYIRDTLFSALAVFVGYTDNLKDGLPKA